MGFSPVGVNRDRAGEFQGCPVGRSPGRTALIVLLPPSLDHLLCYSQSFDPVGVEALRSEDSVKQFNKGIAGRVAGSRESVRHRNPCLCLFQNRDILLYRKLPPYDENSSLSSGMVLPKYELSIWSSPSPAHHHSRTVRIRPVQSLTPNRPKHASFSALLPWLRDRC